MEYNELEGTVAYGPLLVAPLEGFKTFCSTNSCLQELLMATGEKPMSVTTDD